MKLDLIVDKILESSASYTVNKLGRDVTKNRENPAPDLPTNEDWEAKMAKAKKALTSALEEYRDAIIKSVADERKRFI